MKLSIEPIRIETAHPFQIARGTRKQYEVFVVTLESDGLEGMGEAAPHPFYGESPMSVRAAIQSIGRFLDVEPETARANLNTEGCDLFEVLRPHASVRAALDAALWDLRGRREGLPVWKLIGADAAKAPLTSYTIGFDQPEVVDAKVDAAAAYRILKVKVGIPGDMQMLDRIIARSGKTVRVDANEGWDLETAIENTRELFRRRVEFCEQPLPHADTEGLRQLKRVSSLPIVLDESIVDPEDVAACRDQGHGINIKLVKCGGITRALALIEAARACEMSVMIGCMIETSLGVTAAAHVSPLCDYADLDGNLLLASDPFEGVRVAEGRLVLPNEPGLGVRRVG